ncbi:PLP-dependent aminotransferase family protein [Paenibacillus hamazuiensis]|uniref:MocR-like pyridoxine biosynthesis transcription factor PdxR n=1 Tax=Paenibacillus hamazuiensis TaxID=2936508 RepID=UPI00200BF5FC|nr:PLP-dependent aminotransferase family protein [Paenibacillus hamazuiensis]
MFHVPLSTYLQEYGTKTDALYHALKDMILQGTAAHGSKLPSSRELAAQYDLARGTVSQVYDMLAADGYVRTETGKGTFVSFGQRNTAGVTGNSSGADLLSAWGKRAEQAEPPRARMRSPAYPYDFHFGHVDLSRFPSAEWNRCLYAEARRASGELAYGLETPQGDRRLRECLAHYLQRARGIAASPDHIVIVNGSMQAIALLAQLVIDSGDAAVLEQPGYHGISKAVRAAGGVCVYAPVDERGIVPAPWEAKLLFATPSRQFPTGAVLTLERRRELLRWANGRGALIVEDDYDSEFRHRGRPLEPLKALDSEGRVVYIGSFSKTMPAFLRIGYAVLPAGLVAPFCRAKELFEPLPTGLAEQKALAAFMQSGLYERHLRRMKRIYSRKFWHLQQLLKERLAHLFEWMEGDAGLHIFGWWKGDPEHYPAYREACNEAGVIWSESAAGIGEDGKLPRYGAYFQFQLLSMEQMELGVEAMRRAAVKLGLGGSYAAGTN